MIKHLVILFFSFFFLGGFAQNDPKQETTRLMDLLKKNEGTYQIQIIDSRELPTIPLSLMDTIEEKRDINETRYVWLKDNVRVKILSKKEITSTTFQSLERVKYFSSSDIKK